jgi:hypothetical protein
MKKHVLAIFAIFSALLLTAFTSAAEDVPKEKPWREVAKDVHSDIEEPLKRVFRNEGEWKKWWAEQFANSETKDAPKVDFSKETVIVATMGTKPTSGYKIDCTAITRKGEELTAVFTMQKPRLDDMLLQVLTSPYVVIAVPLHAGEVVIEVK